MIPSSKSQRHSRIMLIELDLTMQAGSNFGSTTTHVDCFFPRVTITLTLIKSLTFLCFSLSVILVIYNLKVYILTN